MDLLPLLRRCTQIEQKVGEIYDALGRRFADDRDLSQFWSRLAADEREHAKKLSTWHRLLKHSPTGNRPTRADAFAAGVRDLEQLTRKLRNQADHVETVEQAFAIALALESSELDDIYTFLLQSSPIARFPDLGDTRRMELGPHHRALLDMIRSRSRDERNLTDAALLAAEEG